jgi:hypothetical protein
MRIILEIFGRKNSASSLENRINGRRAPLRSPRINVYQQEVALGLPAAVVAQSM